MRIVMQIWTAFYSISAWVENDEMVVTFVRIMFVKTLWLNSFVPSC